MDRFENAGAGNADEFTLRAAKICAAILHRRSNPPSFVPESSNPYDGRARSERPEAMDHLQHWEGIYTGRSLDRMSWYAPHLTVSLAMIERARVSPAASFLDVGGGGSTLAEDLLARGFEDISVLDLSTAALDLSRDRMGQDAARISWMAGDITVIELPPARYDVWHDRAVFHFLTDHARRAAYVSQIVHSLKAGGQVIIGTFGPAGPATCSGLEVVRYDDSALGRELGNRFRLIESTREMHRTPSGAVQQFLYCRFRFDSSAPETPRQSQD